MENSELKFIYWFAYYGLDSPSVRYRAEYPLKYFKEKYNVDYTLVIPGYSMMAICKFIIAYISALVFPASKSLIVIQRVRSNFVYAKLLKLLVNLKKNNTVYDIDDSDYLEHKAETIYYFAKKCNAVSAGSKKIAEHLSQYNNKVIHTTSPIFDLGIIKKNKNDVFTVGWIGGFGWGHKNSLVLSAFPALKKLSFNFRLIIIGVVSEVDFNFIKDYFKENSNIELEIPKNIEWKNEFSLQEKIVSFDIGIATLLDTEIQISKSGIKAKQYLNNGVPVLSTNLPENNSVIEDGVNGYFCSTVDAFQEKITEFYKMDNEKYQWFSNNARQLSKRFGHDMYFLCFIKLKQLVSAK